MKNRNLIMTLFIVPMLLSGALIVINSVDSEPTRDNAPDLRKLDVSHIKGEKNYTFRVFYRDSDNDAPIGVHLNIDNKSYPMAQENASQTNYTRGVNFTYTKSLTKGEHTYFFNATNQYASARDPVAGYYKLTVEMENGPELVNPFYYPVRPSKDTGIWFNVTYKDHNNNPPACVYLILWNSTANTTYRMTVEKGNYSSGVICSIFLNLSQGNYSYMYWANNSKNQSVSLPSSGSYGVYIAPSSLSENGTVLENPRHLPSYPTYEDTIQFNVTYRDADNDPPSKIWVIVDDKEEKTIRNLTMQTSQNYSYDIGRVYSAQTTLPNGTFYYRFHAVNVNDSVHLPHLDSCKKGYILVVGSGSDRPNTPKIISSSVLPRSPYENQTINFTVSYVDPLDGWHHPVMRLYISPVGGIGLCYIHYYNMTRVGDNFTAGVTYFTTLKLPAGNYSYKYRFWVYNGSFVYPKDYNLTLYVRPVGMDNNPKLLNGSHSVGSEGNVSFSVTYMDTDGDRPSYVNLRISRKANGTYSRFTSYSMSWRDTSYQTGVKASCAVTLSNGSYRYYFAAFSNVNGSAFYPRVGYVYFNVSIKSQPINSAPVLYSMSVTPSRPKSGQLVNFTISYKDNDGDSPLYVRLYLGGVSRNYTSYGMNTVGSCYKTGVTNYKILNLSAGNYTYYFKTSDGTKTISSPSTGVYTLYVAGSSGSGGGDSTPDEQVSGKVTLSEDPEGGIEMEVIGLEEGLTLEVTGYEDGVISLKITSDEVKDRIISFEIEETLLGEETEKGVMIKLDGKEIRFKPLDDLLLYDGDEPFYNIEKMDGKYILRMYIPDTTTHTVEAYMGIDEEPGISPDVVITILSALVVIGIGALGVLFLTMAQRKKRQEAFYQDFDLDLEEREEETVTRGRLNDKSDDWDDLLE